MKRTMRQIIVLVLAIVLSLCALTACNANEQNNDETRKYTLTFDVDGEDYFTISTAGNEVITLPSAPSRTGYDFDGWYFDKDVWNKLLSASTFQEKALSNDIRVYAKWSQRGYDVKFMDGETLWKTIFVAENNFLSEPNDFPKKLGHEFIQWIDKDGEPWDFETVVTEDMDLFANWQIKSYTVTAVGMDALGGTVTGGGEYEYNSEVTLNVVLNEGYAFDGWYKNNQKVSAETEYTFTLGASDEDYVAKWIYNKRQVEFNSRGGTYVEPMLVNAGDKLTAPKQPQRNGYLFAGWYKDEDVQILWDFDNDRVNTNITLYAKWTVDTVGISSVEGATIDGTNISLIIEKDVEFVELAEKVILSGNAYWNLYYDRMGQTMIATKIAANRNGVLNNGDNVFYILVTSQDNMQQKLFTLTIYRRFEARVSFYDFNNNLINLDDLNSITVDTLSTLTTPVWNDESEGFAVNGYTFSHWATSRDEDCEPWVFEEGGTKVEGITNLYAIYTPNTYAISFDVNGGDSDMEDESVTFDAEYVMPTPTRRGYTFIGWYSSTYSNATQYTDGEGNSLANWTIARDTQVYAKWDINYYTVSTSTNIEGAGTYTSTRDYYYKQNITLSASSNLGYTWLGWYDSEGNKVSGDTSYTYLFTMDIDDLSFVAKWMVCPITLKKNISTAGTISGMADTILGQQSTITVTTTNLGYTWLGWYDENDVKVSDGDSISYAFTITDTNKTFTAKWKVWDELSNFYFNYPNPSSCTIIGVIDKTVEKLIIPNYVTNIGEYVFQNCTGTVEWQENSKMTNIGSNAFANYNGTSVIIPEIISSISLRAFNGCSNLIEITIPFVGATKDGTNNTHFGYIFGANSYYYNLDYVPNSLREVIITGGTSIGEDAFAGCSGLTSITIPDSVTSIGENAFYDCSSLTSITIPDSVTSIGEKAFYDCSSLTSITIPDSVTSIGNCAFWGCSGLTSITIPDSVTSIGNYVFYGCSGLTSITIPDSVTSIGFRAFEGCSSLTSITIPDSVTSIGYEVFYGCSSLTSITVAQGNNKYHSVGNCLVETETKTLVMGCKNSVIPNDGSVTSIGNCAFWGCSGLTSITIPDSVTSIGEKAFQYCSSLTSITIPDSVTSIGYMAFEGCSGLTSVYYGGTSSDWERISIAYSNNTILKSAIRYYYSEEEPTSSGNYWHYVDGVVTVWAKEN